MVEHQKQMPLSGKIVGYVAHITPMAAITIYSEGGCFFVRDSSGSSVAIEGDAQAVLAETKKMPEYFELKEMGEIKEGEYAYAFSTKEVIVGNPQFIYGRLEKELRQRSRSSKDLELIKEFLKSNPKDKNPFL